LPMAGRRRLTQVNESGMRPVAARTAELERALVDLNRSNHDLEQFAYVASHDLQEPLRMVSSYVQLLARRYLGRIDTDADDFIRYAVDGAERMKRLINDLLAYSRLGTHSKPYHRVDCNQILKAARENLAIAIQEAAAEIESSHLPHVYGDETQLLQLFQNLLGNAVKFRGTAPPRIRFDATREWAHVHITVSDNGIGIDAQHAERIFDIFRRLHAQGEYAGTGIGLAVCRKIVERHGGKIWVTSQSGSGSTFHVTLPTGTDGATPRTHTDAPAVATTAHGNPQSKGSSA
ncbi:MAG: ATP-binding protein, partial [Verrucomicrobia bacterium]|nr:ATP-binding protein [Verrucomicrobiota bacterium]